MNNITTKHYTTLVLCMFSTSVISSTHAAELTFGNNTLPVIAITPEKSTGLNKIYVCNDISGVTVSYESVSSTNVKWYRFSNMGAAFNEQISSVKYDGKKSTVSLQKNDTGFIIEDDDRSYYFWIVDYSLYPLRINSIAPSQEDNCFSTILDIQGDGDAIHYFTINGQQQTLSRDIHLSYFNLEWNRDSKIFNQAKIDKVIPYLSSTVTLSPPVYTPTTFLLSGDRFLEFWGESVSAESGVYNPTSVAVETEAIQETVETDNSDGSNQISIDTDGLGGSAPVDISFNAFTTDAVLHNEWQMATDEEFENITYRINEQDFNYTFTEEGTVYVRFIGSNSDGSCEAVGDTYTVSIGASELQIPNAFSPNDDGINDMWKVSYRSLLDFHCWIFDRNGHQLFEFTDPSSGWDGKHNGKTVSPGVYYYVITATGSDGKRYKQSGDINIIRYKGGKSTTTE